MVCFNTFVDVADDRKISRVCVFRFQTNLWGEFILRGLHVAKLRPVCFVLRGLAKLRPVCFVLRGLAKLRPVCFVFERAWHEEKAFQGHQGNDQGGAWMQSSLLPS